MTTDEPRRPPNDEPEEEHIPDATPESSPVSRFALAVLGFAFVPALVGALAGFGSRWGLWSFSTGFSILRWAAYGGIAVMVLGAAAAVRARPGAPRKGLAAAVVAFMLGALTFGVPWSYVRTARSVPPIHDITTDTGDPPAFRAVAPLRADAPNPVEYPGSEVARQQQEAYPDIRPAIMDLGFDRAFERALATAEAQGWNIVEADAEEGRIEATDQTFWFGFTDDVVIRVTPLNGRSVVDVRSKSRVGRSDVGKNAERIRNYLDDLQG